MVRELYERAIANVPPAEEKRLWRRYIYLWINYALYEELEAKVLIRIDINSSLKGHPWCPSYLRVQKIAIPKIFKVFNFSPLFEMELVKLMIYFVMGF